MSDSFLRRPARLFSCLLAVSVLSACQTVSTPEEKSSTTDRAAPVRADAVSQPASLTLATTISTGKVSRAPAHSASTAQRQRAGLEAQSARTGFSPIASVRLESSLVPGLQPPEDLWGRIRQGFAMSDLQTQQVEDRIRWYVRSPGYLQRMTARSSKYLFHIVEELERRNMPTELALLPFVESAFNPEAVSHAKAAGMWQFMPATGASLDLRQNVFRDDRRDVLASTRAALDYLEQLHNRFGDWHLALAAYNWGQGNVSRARTSNQDKGLGTQYLDLSMPEETRMYIPKLQALKEIVSNPRKYGVDLAEIGNHPYFETVDVQRDMDVDLVARLAGISEQDFRSLNPAHNGPVIFAAATKEVLLPWDNAQTYKNNLRRHRNGKLASWTVWQTPRTMNTTEIAQHFGIHEDVLRSVNRIPSGMLVATGSAVLVPRAQSVQRDVSAELAHSGQLRLQAAGSH